MVGAEGALEDLQRALEKLLGVRIAAECTGDQGQIVQGLRDIGMAGPEHLFPNGERTPIEGLGFGISPLVRRSSAKLLRATPTLGCSAPSARSWMAMPRP